MHMDSTEQRIKHLEMIKEIISHYVNLSARMKNFLILFLWSFLVGFLIIVGTIYGTVLKLILVDSSSISETINVFDKKEVSADLFYSVVKFAAIALGVIPTLILILIVGVCRNLDLKYSQKAKLYNELYNRVRAQPSSQEPDFCINLPSCIAKGRDKWTGFGEPDSGSFQIILGLCFFGGFFIAFFVFIAATLNILGIFTSAFTSAFPANCGISAGCPCPGPAG